MAPSFRTFINNTKQDLGQAWNGLTNAANEIYTGFTKPHPDLPRSDIFKGSLLNADNALLNIPQGVGQVATDFNNLIPDTLNMGIDFANSFYPNRDRFKRLPKFDNYQWGRQYVPGAHPASAAGGVIAGSFLTPGAVAKSMNIPKYINKAQNIGRRVKNRWNEIEKLRGTLATPVSVVANSKSPSGYNINLAKALRDRTFRSQMVGQPGYPDLAGTLHALGLDPQDYKIMGFLADGPEVRTGVKSAYSESNFALKDDFWYRRQKLSDLDKKRRLTPPQYVTPKSSTINPVGRVNPHDITRSADYFGDAYGRGQQGPLFFARSHLADYYADYISTTLDGVATISDIRPADGIVTAPAIVASDKFLTKAPNGRVLVTPNVKTIEGPVFPVARPARIRKSRGTMAASAKGVAQQGMSAQDYLKTPWGLFYSEATRPSGRGVDASDITDLLVPFKLAGKDSVNTMHLARLGTRSGIDVDRYVHPVVERRPLGSETLPSVFNDGKSRITSPEMWIHNMLNRKKPRLTPNSAITEFNVPVR